MDPTMIRIIAAVVAVAFAVIIFMRRRSQKAE